MSNQDAIKFFINTFFEKKKSKYYILRVGAGVKELNEELNTIIKKNPKIRIPLKINPKILELCQSSIKAYQANEVLDEYLKKYFNKNKEKNFSDLYDAVFMLIRYKEIFPKNNNSAVEKLLKNKLDDLIVNYRRSQSNNKNSPAAKKLFNKQLDKLFAKYVGTGTADIKVLKKKLRQQIRVIHFAIECGFTTWEQLINMLIFLRNIYEKKIEDKFDFELSNTNQSNNNSYQSNNNSYQSNNNSYQSNNNSTRYNNYFLI